jgi:Zn ribbon nucleic-acid-binding protein
MFQTYIFRENFNKVLMQCSHSKHANIIQMWGNDYNKTKIECIWCKYHIYQNFKKCPKNGKHELHAIVYAKKI